MAAKTLAHDYPAGTFKVTVFEKLPRIGGLWPTEKIDDGLVNPDMCVNQSRHTVSFSDLAWPDTGPQFPKAWQVGQYLERYIEAYPGYDIRMNSAVSKIEYDNTRWKVHVQNPDSKAQAESLDFDHVIIGTGFFGKARVPDQYESLEVPIVHSSQVRDIRDLLKSKETTSPPGKRIVVVGGQMSGVEIAAFIANQLSSATHSIEDSGITDISEYYITHVVNSPSWVMPFLFPRNPVMDFSAPEKVS